MKEIRLLNKLIGDNICAMGTSLKHTEFLLSKENTDIQALNEALIFQNTLLALIEDYNKQIIKLTNERY
jgi:hypothetical protein